MSDAHLFHPFHFGGALTEGVSASPFRGARRLSGDIMAPPPRERLLHRKYEMRIHPTLRVRFLSFLALLALLALFAPLIGLLSERMAFALGSAIPFAAQRHASAKQPA